jgi:hypothetical protein
MASNKLHPLIVAQRLDSGARFEQGPSGGMIVCSSSGDAIEVERALKDHGHFPSLSPGDNRIYLDL